jgi:hypothetical protein
MSSREVDSLTAGRVRIQPDLFGFRVEVAGRPRAVVELATWFLRVHGAGVEAARLDLADSSGLCSAVLSRLNPGGRRITRGSMAEMSLAGGIERHRLRLIARVPSQVYRVHERIHRETLPGVSHLHRSRDFYDRRYLVADVLKFRAAAIAVNAVRVLCKGDLQVHYYDDKALERLEESWLGLFSPDGRAYGSLRRTLMNLPEEVPAPLLPALRLVHLPRPVTDPLELTTICAALAEKQRMWRYPDLWPDRLKILLHAKATEIQEAVTRVAESTRRLDLRGLSGVIFLVRYLDFPESHTGRLGGLVEKAIRWHGHVARGTLEERLEKLDLPPRLKRLDTPTAPPEFPIPADSRIRFLDTVGSILEEGRDMGHCVATLAATAVRGLAYFFHVEFGGQKATVELNRRGKVVEAAGPRNSDNEAVRWGCRTLEECARSAAAPGVDDDAFATVRERFGGASWLKIAELLHRRAGAEREGG